MSHVVSISTEVRNPTAIAAACQRLGLAVPVEGIAQLYSARATGWLVQLPDWRYPVVCDTATGQMKFDNFGGRWGEQSRLNQFLQAYAVETARNEARKRGHDVYEQPLSDGSIKLTIQVGGAP